MIKVGFVILYFIFLLHIWLNPVFIRTLKKIVRWIIGIAFALYLLLIGSLNIPTVQRKISNVVANQLATHLETEISIGRINMGLLNRIIIEDLYVEDQQQTELLKVARLAARFDIMALFKGKISINNVQLFGFDLKLAKEKPTDELNLQFI